jgi:hypothetical protein
MDLHVNLPDPLNVNAQHVVELSTCATQLGITLLRGVSPVARRRDLMTNWSGTTSWGNTVWYSQCDISNTARRAPIY